MTRAIIEQVLNNYHVRVRVPEYDGKAGTADAAATSELPIATVCCLPGIVPKYRIGDVVFIEYEGDTLEYPVVIGLIASAGNTTTMSDIHCDSLHVNVNCELPINTEIQE